MKCIPNVIQKLVFTAARKYPGIKYRKRPKIKSMRERLLFLIPGVLGCLKYQLLNHVRYTLFVAVFLACFSFNQLLFSIDPILFKKEIENCPKWMLKQIERDLNYLKEVDISLTEINELFNQSVPEHFIVKFSIDNNVVSVEKKINHPCIEVRINSYLIFFQKLCKLAEIPNVTFFIFMHDGIVEFPELYKKLPMFVMSRSVNSRNCILIPDYEAVNERYQVLNKKDITRYVCPWAFKKNKLIWRGSIDQDALDYSTNIMTASNTHLFSRVKLCELSLEFPDVLDAKFTLFKNEDRSVPYLKNFRGDWIDYEEIFSYKYQMQIHGNVSAFSCSGWRFFSNSLVFIPESRWIQWYSGNLIPYVHYIPVKSNLDDLIEKLLWAQKYDEQARQIATNAREFALEHLTFTAHFVYFYFLFEKYSQLSFSL